ncbi:ribulose-phosphate 3-epimerase [Candidatus Woesearchaeota archaeon]|nr:ribulose-phosphate 3-epimerase [Candidatus Woesearchaeota archaeon]
MCADQLQIMDSVIALVKLGVDYFHLDVMDGNFVNNLALNLDIIAETRKLTRIPFDVHLMVQKPSQYFDQLIDSGADIIVFHVECAEDVKKNIEYIKNKGAKAGLALHLETPPSALEKYLHLIDYVLVMNVKTGFASQKFGENALKKTNLIYSLIQKNGYDVKIFTDGGVGPHNVEELYNRGADIAVAGTTLLFNNRGYSNNLENFRKIQFDINNRTVQDVDTSPSETRYKAAVLRDIRDLAIIEKTLRPIAEDEVVVKVMSSGICGSDLVRVYKKGMYSKNLVPGHEFSGMVVKTSDSNTHLLNKRVAVFPLIPCRKCEYCNTKQYNLCENYNYLGSRTDGGFAELVVTPQANLIQIPSNVSYDEAALLEPMAVSYRGTAKIPNIRNSDAIVLGLGPVGILAGMMCKKLGANTVTGIDRNPHKWDIAKKTGFDECCGPVKDFPEKPFNVLIDCSGASDLINKYILALKKGSSILLLGNHQEPLCIPPSTMSTILRSEFNLFSSWNSNICDQDNDWKTCVNFLARKDLDVSPLITHNYPLDDIYPALDKMNNKQIKYLKVIINPN